MSLLQLTMLSATVQINGTDVNILSRLGLAILIGLFVAFIITSGWKSQLKSVYRQHGAADYKKDNSFKLSVKKDTFLYTKIEKREKPKQQENNPQ